MWNRIASIKQFAKVDEYIFIQDSMHFIVGNNLNYLCSILNSKIIQWYLSMLIGEAVGGNAGNADNILNLPIPLCSNDNSVTDEHLYLIYQLSSDEISFIENQEATIP